jgi:hypothetical protein
MDRGKGNIYLPNHLLAPRISSGSMWAAPDPFTILRRLAEFPGHGVMKGAAGGSGTRSSRLLDDARRPLPTEDLESGQAHDGQITFVSLRSRNRCFLRVHLSQSAEGNLMSKESLS